MARRKIGLHLPYKQEPPTIPNRRAKAPLAKGNRRELDLLTILTDVMSNGREWHRIGIYRTRNAASVVASVDVRAAITALGLPIEVVVTTMPTGKHGGIWVRKLTERKLIAA